MESRDVSGALVALQTGFLEMGLVVEIQIQETTAGPRLNILGVDPGKAEQVALALTREAASGVIRS